MLIKIINKQVNENNEKRKREYFYVTDIKKCTRKVYLDFQNIETPLMEVNVLRKFANGNSVHERLIKDLKSVIVKTEFDIPRDALNIHGRVDALVLLDNKNYILEIKSMNCFSFKYMLKARESDIKQIMLYMHYTNIKDGILLYECKNSQEIKEFYIKYDKRLSERLIYEFKTLSLLLKRKQIPKKSPKEDWECKYCVYKGTEYCNDD